MKPQHGSGLRVSPTRISFGIFSPQCLARQAKLSKWHGPLSPQSKTASKGRPGLLAEMSSLRTTLPKQKEMRPADVELRLNNLAKAVQENGHQVFPLIRSLFPKKVRFFPKGKALDGSNLYAMKGQIVLNGALAQPFERMLQKQKGEVASALPLSSDGRTRPAAANSSESSYFSKFSNSSLPCDSKGLGFSVLEIGVADGT